MREDSRGVWLSAASSSATNLRREFLNSDLFRIRANVERALLAAIRSNKIRSKKVEDSKGRNGDVPSRAEISLNENGTSSKSHLARERWRKNFYFFFFIVPINVAEPYHRCWLLLHTHLRRFKWNLILFSNLFWDQPRGSVAKAFPNEMHEPKKLHHVLAHARRV